MDTIAAPVILVLFGVLRQGSSTEAALPPTYHVRWFRMTLLFYKSALHTAFLSKNQYCDMRYLGDNILTNNVVD